MGTLLLRFQQLRNGLPSLNVAVPVRITFVVRIVMFQYIFVMSAHLLESEFFVSVSKLILQTTYN